MRLLSNKPWSWEITFRDNTAAHRPLAMPQLRADDTALTPGGVIGNSATADELSESFKEDDPSMRLPDAGDRYAAGAVVEDLRGIFEKASISGGTGRNTLVVGDADGEISVGGSKLSVSRTAAS